MPKHLHQSLFYSAVYSNSTYYFISLHSFVTWYPKICEHLSILTVLCKLQSLNKLALRPSICLQSTQAHTIDYNCSAVSLLPSHTIKWNVNVTGTILNYSYVVIKHNEWDINWQQRKSLIVRALGEFYKIYKAPQINI